MARSKFEIYIDVLEALACGGPMKFTRIRHKANYHANDLKVLLEFFVKKNLIISRTEKMAELFMR